MRETTRWRWSTLGQLGCGLAMVWTVQAQVAKPPPTLEVQPSGVVIGSSPAIPPRWRDTFQAFDAADKAQAPAVGGVVFVGSSSIRLWADLEKQFEDPIAIIKRGFGGSSMADSAEHLQRLVLPYKPRLVVVYAGDNDLAEGRSPQDVLASFTAFVEGVRKDLPKTRIAYLSIKPSPSRAALLDRVRQTNELIAAYTRATPNLDYIDVYSKMLDADGQPRRELFLGDNLHLNEQGYALWKSVIATHLQGAGATPTEGRVGRIADGPRAALTVAPMATAPIATAPTATAATAASAVSAGSRR